MVLAFLLYQLLKFVSINKQNPDFACGGDLLEGWKSNWVKDTFEYFFSKYLVDLLLPLIMIVWLLGFKPVKY